MAISSKTLFHFTSSLSTIEKILECKGFRPNFCIEYGWKREFAVCQCSFCDIPLSNVASHMKVYGKFAIGMKKEWGKENGIGPVLYCVLKTYFSQTLNDLFDPTTKSEIMARCLSMVKIYEGANKRVNLKTGEKYLYYNEREWRYVPALEWCKQVILSDKSGSVNTKKIEERNALAKDKKCHFQADDVKYLLVENNDDRRALMKFIDGLDNYTPLERELLKSKIILNELILEDI